MVLVQLLLPLYDNSKSAFARDLFDRVRAELTEQFGGVTVYQRAPATGLWKDGGEITRDDVVIYEVMTEKLDRGWWAEYRNVLAERFRQDVLVARAIPIEPL